MHIGLGLGIGSASDTPADDFLLPGNYALTGFTANWRYRMTLESGLYALTGSDAATRYQTPLTSGAYTLTGSALSVTTIPWFAYWDADDGVTVSGSDVTSWADQVSGYAVTPPGANKPTLSTASFSGRNAIKFVRASAQSLCNTTTSALYGAADGDDPSITIVWQAIAATTPNTAVPWFFGGTSGASANRLDIGDNGSATQLQLRDSGATGSGTQTYTGLSSTTAASHVFALVLSGTTQTLYQDNVVNASVGAINATARTGACFTIGAFSNTGTFAYDGYIRRVGIIKAATSVGQLTQIYNGWNGT